jgi:hypothetical protein
VTVLYRGAKVLAKEVAKTRRQEQLRLNSQSSRYVKLFGEFSKDINKSGSPIERVKTES